MKKIIAFVVAALVGIGSGLLLATIVQMTSVTDNTMLPNYSEGQSVLVNKIAYRKDLPAKGDIVMFSNQVHSTTGESSLMMKRVIGTQGDHVLITAGKIYVNNKALAEEYVFSQGSSGEMEEIKIEENHVFVLGDNRAASTDSRHETVGQVAVKDILGKVIFKW